MLLRNLRRDVRKLQSPSLLRTVRKPTWIAMKSLLALLVAAWLPTSLAAENRSFDVRLAGAIMGRVTVALSGGNGRLDSVLDNTPLGVGDGRFTATTRAGAYRSLGEGGGERRAIDIDFAGNRVAAVRIDPPGEATAASDPGQIPAGVLDPVQGFARVALADGCLRPFRIYDGRRTVRVGLVSQSQDGGLARCDYAYDVVQGPGHVSPFRFRQIRMSARYAPGASGAQDIRLSAGPFTVTLAAR